ncbi:hypothetical protein ACTWPT_09880 [Nonomuraea sp. 3N208]|uniref:hypothetical protein n=1 Tax=Nonomuraea sp. 3N208 TaxID=3457421 RepID=UPI003FCEC0AD
MSGHYSPVGRRTPAYSRSEHEYGIVHATGLLVKSHIVRTVTLPKSLGSQGGVVRGKPEVISTGRWYRFVHAQTCGGPLDAATVPASVASVRTAVDILHHRPEQPGFAHARHRPRPVPVGRCRPRLTVLANVGSDDLAVIRHASPPWQK